jgi:adhesin/invasin
MKKKRYSSPRRFKPLIKYLAWSQIAIQGLMPAVLAFTPAVMAADKPVVTYEHSQLLPELSVPVATSSVKSPTAGSNSADSSAALAQNAKIMAGLASSENSAGAAQQFAVGQVTQKATQEVENWLNHYGNARISISTNASDDFNMDGSSFDFLLPVWDQKNALTFMQFDTHYQDSDRLIGNIGVGQRFFLESGWMLGINAFYDQDLTGNTSRAGVGGEVWATNFKFSGNGYFAISDWHNSDELDDYDEKAANGFDLQVDGYLPAYPQLGGKLKYEKYFGDKVALFDTDHLQTDPSAVTVGLNYTPIPLITAGVDYKTGQDGQNDTQLKLDFNYALGVPWSEQISSDAVALRRSLAGSRLDFVNRNNDIVMQYRKQDVISLGLPDHLTGEVLSTQALLATINTKYGAKRIDWDSGSTLLTAGGKVTKVDVSHYTVTMPPTAGEFRLRGVAYDRKGNASNVAETIFTANPASLHSSLTVDSTKLAVNKVATYTLAVTDASGAPAAGATIAWSNDLGTFSAQATTTDGKGNATATLTSTTPGVAHVSATANGGTATKAPDVTFTADNATARVTTLELAAPKSVVANGSDKLIYTVTVKDANGNPVADQSISWASTVGTPSSATSSTTAQGQATMTVSSTAAGSTKVTASTNNTSVDNSEGQFTVDPSSVVISALDVAPATELAADGTSLFTFTATVKNAAGDPVPDVTVNWGKDSPNAVFKAVSSKGARASAGATSTTDANGTAQISLTNTIAELVNVTAQVGGTAAQNKSVTFIADVNTAGISLAANPANNVAVNDGVSTLTATVTDSNGNPVNNATVTWSSASTTATITGDNAQTSKTNAQGIATATVKDSAVEVVSIKAETSKGTAGTANQSVQVSFIENTSNLKVTLASKDSTIAAGNTGTVLTATVTSGNNAALPGATVDWASITASYPNVTLSASSSTTDANGVASVTIKDTRAETVSATVNASISGSTVTSNKVDITFTADEATAKITLDANPKDGVKADGATASTLTATVVDVNGNPVSTAITWSTDKGKLANQQTPSDVSTGKATATLTDTTAETATVTAKIATGAATSASTSVVFVQDLSQAVLTLDASPKSVVADGTTASTVTAKVADGSGQGISGIVVTLDNGGKGQLSQTSVTTDSDGTATATLTDTIVEQVTVNATISEGATKSASTSVEFTQSSGVAASVTLSAPAQAYWTDYKISGSNKQTLTATVKDAGGNPVTAGTVTLKPATNLTAQAENSGTPDSSGNVTVDVESATASAGYTLQACTTGSNNAEVCSTAVTLPFYDPPIITVDHLIGDTSKTSIPAERLQAGEVQLSASGGNASYVWASSDSSAISVDSSGKATMLSKGAVDITITSLGRTGKLNVGAASKMLFINLSNRVVYADAASAAGGTLPMKDAIKTITDEWGNIAAYTAYASHSSSVNVWTGDVDPSEGNGASTYDIMKDSYVTSVDPTLTGGFAADIN